MEVRLLGPLATRIGREPVEVTAPKQRIVLATLALRANQLVPADDLVDRLWGDDPPATARATLHNHVMRLRKVMCSAEEPFPLVTRAPGYRLELPDNAVDVHVFQRLRAEARRAEADGDQETEARLLHVALALWRGPALVDIPSEVMQREDALGWRDAWIETVERRVEVDLALGRHADLVTELRALVKAHPLRERLWGQLMLALQRTGRRGEALDAYQQACEILMDEFGVEPSAWLRDLRAQILAADDTPAPPAC